MNTEIRDITVDNVKEILALHVAQEQANYVETPEECLEEAKQDTHYIPVGLYVEETPVGFAMYGEFPDDIEGRRIWLDRYFIDSHYQGKGYGKLFCEHLLQFLTEKYGCNKIYLSVYEDNEIAINMYKKLDFHFNGELDIKGEKVMVRVIQ
ncbi:GNAT family N-acetyltransferase [Solibacillus sp. CAU 1738]|uniref:GNAT family N-acetyltransferase n=1 Tax=Solibacillus sp. CAU 1738 TaxID=3140363 RepID=UPI0032602F51